MIKIRRALVSVSDKRGLDSLGACLARHGIEVLSTGGTARALAAAGVAVKEVAAHTGAPEILDGRVKTLHPKIHGGLLGRPTPAHEKEMADHDIAPIDLVVVNLYPFAETIARPETTFAEAVEQIDIGGPSMIRSAAKNHERVAVLVDPDDYAAIITEIDATGGAVSEATRRTLAQKAFATTAAYDARIAAYLATAADCAGEATKATEAEASDKPAPPPQFPAQLTATWQKALDLRYGENPHQAAAFYRLEALPLAGATAGPTLATAKVLQGKPLSYNNLLDLDAALACCLDHHGPTAVIVKHTNPCGVATSETSIAAAYRAARATDPVSAFGGIVALNREVDAELAGDLAETFLECIAAPGFATDALAILSKKKNLRLLATGEISAAHTGWALRSIAGGLLVQSADTATEPAKGGRVVTRRAPTEAEFSALDFGWRVAKHVKSNAIVFCHPDRTAAIGAGQMSRVDAAKLAMAKAQGPLANTAVASDAFFPFRDGIDALHEAGATCVIQPGGSIRDDEVIAACDEHDMAMVFTGVRHFRH